MLRKLNDIVVTAYFGFFALLLAMMPKPAHAQLSNVIRNIRENITNIPTLISYGAYIGGFMLVIAGVLKIRQHVDKPEVPLKDGLVRLFAGACLIAIPWVAETVIKTISGGSTTGGPSVTKIETQSYP